MDKSTRYVFLRFAHGCILLDVRVECLNNIHLTFVSSLQRCFSRNGGTNAVWYDGSLTGQFTAAPYSSLAANSSGPGKTHVYFQEKDTDKIVELYREGTNTFDPFVLIRKAGRPAALKGTRIATDSNVGGPPEVYYQDSELNWVLDGGSEQGVYIYLHIVTRIYITFCSLTSSPPFHL